MEASKEFETLCREIPLPPRWSRPDCYAETVAIEGMHLVLTGLVSTSRDGTDVTGSAAETEASSVRRAYFELLERAATLDIYADTPASVLARDATGAVVREHSGESLFPNGSEGMGWTYSRSNGVAAASDWQTACRAAYAELTERHRVLCAWFGLTIPKRLPQATLGPLVELASLYEVETVSFPAPAAPAKGDEQVVVGVFAFPLMSMHPFVCGFAAGPSLTEAQARAERECLQRLGFLWGEEIPSQEPAVEKSPAYHQELYLWPPKHAAIRAWLAANHAGKGELRGPGLGASDGASPTFVDLTPAHLVGKVSVAKALDPTLLPLTFGQGHPWVTTRAASLGVHPIA